LILEEYIVLPVLSEEQVAWFRALYDKLHLAAPEFFYKSYYNPIETYMKEVEALIMACYQPGLDQYLVICQAF
jgi:hypothetical protein